MSQEQVGMRMKEAAEAAGLDPYQVAAALGVRSPTVYRWYKGQTRPANALMDSFAALVGRASAYLLSGTEELEVLLLRWAHLVHERLGGTEAVRAIRGDVWRMSEEEQSLLNEMAPGMLVLLNQMAGSDWEALEPNRQLEVMGRLLAELQQWRDRHAP